jgi:hypothetical protein
VYDYIIGDNTAIGATHKYVVQPFFDLFGFAGSKIDQGAIVTLETSGVPYVQAAGGFVQGFKTTTLAFSSSRVTGLAAEGATAQSFSRSRITQGFQDHHIVSDKNPLTMNHELLDMAGYNLQSRGNMIFLPETAMAHPTRSIHSGRHLNSVSQSLSDQMDVFVGFGKAEGWSQVQYRQALDSMIAQERAVLRSGERALNKNRR